ncbi:MAG: 50S ribosomal protein L29 [Rickettsia sp.]|nr:50S ribosomal protein L29 [Rickettsia sp.]
MLKNHFKPFKKAFLVEKDLKTLFSFLLELKKAIFELRFSKKIASVKNTSNISKIKKNVARIKTEIFSREKRIKN